MGIDHKHEKTRFHVMTKPCGSSCNLNCKYCYYLEKENLYDIKNPKISNSLLKNYIKKYIESQPTDEVLFTWQGGEPSLCNLDFYKKVVEFQKRYKGDKKINNSFQTNGTLLDDEWASFFKKNDFFVGLSVDGPEEIHNFYRKDKAGKGTFKQVMKAVKLLHKYNVPFNTLTTVNAYNVNYSIEVYDFLKSLGGGLIQFLPVVERQTDDESEALKLVNNNYSKEANLTDESVNSEKFGGFLIQIFDKWVRNDVGTVFVQHFETALQAWCGEHPSLCVFSPICGAELVMEHNGDLYSCDHFVYPENKIGNIYEDDLQEIMRGDKQIDFAFAKSKERAMKCNTCKYIGACNGDCPKHRFTKQLQGNNLSYLCKGLHDYFEHIEPFMIYMGKEIHYGRSPTSIMESINIINKNSSIL